MDLKFNSVSQIITAIQQGEMVVLLDDEDRENEGDLVIAAEKITPEIINFMATHARGLICLTIDKHIANRLGLNKMVTDNQGKYGTNFTVSIEAKEGVTTGISAKDRATTVLTAINPNSHHNDIVSPGHIFPIVAMEGGVLQRAGHTEAGSELAELAGLQPASVIVEILNRDGTMARKQQLFEFANNHQLKIGTIKSLIQHKLKFGSLITKLSEMTVNSKYGAYQLISFYSQKCDIHCFAIKFGDFEVDEPILTRVHVINPLIDILQIDALTDSWKFDEAMSFIAKHKKGVVVLLNSEPNVLGSLQADLKCLSQSNKVSRPYDHLNIGIGAQVLHQIGVRRMRLMSQNDNFNLSGFGLEIVDCMQPPKQ